jgi:hypothetical protein
MGRHNLRLRISSRYGRLSTRPRISTGRFGSVLDSTISVGTVLKYSAIILLFIVVFGFVFMLGQHYADKNAPAETEEEQTKIESATSTDAEPSETEKDPVNEDPNEEVTEKEAPVETAEEIPAETTETAPAQEVDTTPKITTTETPKETTLCVAKSAGFDYQYSKINATVSAINTEKKGDNWAVITSVEISISNNENCIIANPTQIKIKMNTRGKGSSWWDDETFLPDTFLKLMPGETVMETVPVHVSYSDIYMEKDFKLVVFDEYGIDMATYKKYVTLK